MTEPRVRIDRHRCLGAGTCIIIAPTVFGWYRDEFHKATVIDQEGAEEEVIREAVYACPTQAIIYGEAEEAVLEALGQRSGGPIAVSGRAATRTFMFTDIVRSTDLIEAIGDEAWAAVLRWHDDTLQRLFAPAGEVINHTGDGFFVAFDQASSALACAVTIQRTLAAHRREHGFAPEVRIGLHTATGQAGRQGYRGREVHIAARVAALAGAGEIFATSGVFASGVDTFPTSAPREEHLKGISTPVEVVTVEWR
ncbi:MAG TPA: ferredoxin [Candidatus Limnocylindrales bacterium]|nr:ferredoxin [Candidatus Limnocylindrales bacterium]